MSSTTPYYNRFSCCHGADDAYARIYGYFKRELARVSVRAQSYRPMRIKNFGSIWGLLYPPRTSRSPQPRFVF